MQKDGIYLYSFKKSNFLLIMHVDRPENIVYLCFIGMTCMIYKTRHATLHGITQRASTYATIIYEYFVSICE